MSYNANRKLGQDDFELWPSELYQPIVPLTSEQAENLEQAQAQIQTVQSQDTSSWWGQITGALVPISQAAANIIRATKGVPTVAQQAPVPSGYTRTSTGQIVPITAYQAGGFNVQSLILPAALGIGAFMLLSGGRRRRR